MRFICEYSEDRNKKNIVKIVKTVNIVKTMNLVQMVKIVKTVNIVKVVNIVKIGLPRTSIFMTQHSEDDRIKRVYSEKCYDKFCFFQEY